MHALIAIPALNEERTIATVIAGLPRELPGITAIEVLVVDDGSTDETSSIAESAGATVLRHPRNLGVGRAFQTAVGHALQSGIGVLVTVDADGQFDTDEIPSLLHPITHEGADFVTGSRFTTGSRPDGMPIFKYLGNKAVTRIIRHFSGSDLSDVSCGFRAYSREALLHLNLFGKFTYTQETILDMSFKDLRLAEVPINVTYFANRKSRVAGSLTRYAINSSTIIIRTARDFKPMRFFGVIGVAIFALGLAAESWLMLHYLETSSFTPYKVVGVVGLSLNALGLAVAGIGLLADMLDRIRMNQERLLYYHKLAQCAPHHRRTVDELESSPDPDGG